MSGSVACRILCGSVVYYGGRDLGIGFHVDRVSPNLDGVPKSSLGRTWSGTAKEKGIRHVSKAGQGDPDGSSEVQEVVSAAS